MATSRAASQASIAGTWDCAPMRPAPTRISRNVSFMRAREDSRSGTLRPLMRASGQQLPEFIQEHRPVPDDAPAEESQESQFPIQLERAAQHPADECPVVPPCPEPNAPRACRE